MVAINYLLKIRLHENMFRLRKKYFCLRDLGCKEWQEDVRTPVISNILRFRKLA